MKSAIIANYCNIVMGIFQVASIIELFFVLGSIKQATEENSGEPKQPSVLGIAITYFLASLTSMAVMGFLIYLMCTFENTEQYRTYEYKFSARAFIVLAVLLTFGVVLLSIRLCKLQRMGAPIEDGRRTLRNYYAVFMIGYLTRVIVNFTIIHNGKNSFLTEMLFDCGQWLWDAFPIFCILLFHFRNFKPHQHELIIRIPQENQFDLSIHNSLTNQDGVANMSDGMF